MGAVCVEKKLIFPEGRITMSLSVSVAGAETLRKTLMTRDPSGPKRGLSGLWGEVHSGGG